MNPPNRMQEQERCEAAIQAELERQIWSIAPKAKLKMKEANAKKFFVLIVSALSQGKMEVAQEMVDLFI